MANHPSEPTPNWTCGAATRVPTTIRYAEPLALQSRASAPREIRPELSKSRGGETPVNDTFGSSVASTKCAFGETRGFRCGSDAAISWDASAPQTRVHWLDSISPVRRCHSDVLSKIDGDIMYSVHAGRCIEPAGAIRMTPRHDSSLAVAQRELDLDDVAVAPAGRALTHLRSLRNRARPAHLSQCAAS